MNDSITTLKDFIESAEKSRKYPRNTVLALNTALKLFEPELNEEEKASVKKFHENLDSIYAAVYEKNKTKYSTGSLDTYRRRISRLVKDYFSYGLDASKMNSWKPPVRTISNSKSATKPKQHLQADVEAPFKTELLDKVDRIEWSLSDGRKALLALPLTLTKSEAETLKGLIDLKTIDS